MHRSIQQIFDRHEMLDRAHAALALPPSPDTLPCGCVNHDGGPYAPGCAAMSDAEPSVYAEIIDCGLNWIQDDNDTAQRTIPEGWQHAIPVMLAAPDMLAALQWFLRMVDKHGIGDSDNESEPGVNFARAAIARATGRESAPAATA